MLQKKATPKDNACVWNSKIKGQEFMIHNLCTLLMTTFAVCLTGCQEHEKVAPGASSAAQNEQAIPEPSVAHDGSSETASEELPFIVDDADLEEISANDVDQELTIDPAEGKIQ